MISRWNPVPNPEMRVFLHTLRALNPSASRRVPVSSHAARAQSHRFAAGPGLVNTKEIKRLREAGLQAAAQANVQLDAEIGQKDHFRMETTLKKPQPAAATMPLEHSR